MNLYLIKRYHNRFIEDAFSFAIVAAVTVKAARHIHPTKGVTWGLSGWIKDGKDYGFDVWAHPTNVRAKLLGKAVAGTLAGTVCTAFT